MSAQQAPEYCRYRMDHVNNTLTLPFTGCHVKEEDDDVCYRKVVTSVG